jgi:simple sugar transport system ATP-binding protein
VTTAGLSLALEHIAKRFGTTQALRDASLRVRQGTVHALLGENGAGKTTLMRVAYGMEAPDQGEVRIGADAVHLRSPADALARGVGKVHQHFTLVPAMTVAENIALGHHGRFDAAGAAGRVRELASVTGLVADPAARVGDLPVSAQQRVELLKVLSRQVDVLVLDEPTAVLAPAEVDALLRQLREFADAGRAVVLITHKLREALSIADDVTVLRRGVTTLAEQSDAIDEERLIDAMLGHQHATLPPTRTTARAPGATVIRARDVSIVDARGSVRIQGATFDVRRGELVGVAAVEGSGHHELLRAIAGRQSAARGVLELPSSVGFVADDRHRDGLILGMTLSENVALNGAGSRRGTIRWRQIAAATRAIMNRFDIRAESEEVLAGTLSGGNQQRLILGRELSNGPVALVAENPTRGLDLQASAYVHERLLAACDDGVAIVLHSADIDEILSVCHRVLVVHAGTVREVQMDRDVVGRAMLGAS